MTTLKDTSRESEVARKKAREELHNQMSGMSLTEKVHFLKKSFKCTGQKGVASQKKDYITGSKSFFGKEKITNNCQFQPKTVINLKHIIGYCCNEHYELCPLYQYFACSSALMSNIRH